MKKFIYFLPTLLLSFCFFSCEKIPLEYYQACYETVCKYTTCDYEEGDRLVYECSEGLLDTLVVTRITKDYKWDRLKNDEEEPPEPGMSYATINYGLYSPDESKRATFFVIGMSLIHEDYQGNELSGFVGLDNYNKNPSEGCGASFEMKTLSNEDIWRSVPQMIDSVTYAELKKNIGLYFFRDRNGNTWTYKKKLK